MDRPRQFSSLCYLSSGAGLQLTCTPKILCEWNGPTAGGVYFLLAVSAFPMCGVLDQFDTSSPLAALRSIPPVYASVVRPGFPSTSIVVVVVVTCAKLSCIELTEHQSIHQCLVTVLHTLFYHLLLPPYTHVTDIHIRQPIFWSVDCTSVCRVRAQSHRLLLFFSLAEYAIHTNPAYPPLWRDPHKPGPGD